MPAPDPPKHPPPSRLHLTPATDLPGMLDPHIPPPIRLAAAAPLKRETKLPRVVDAHQLMQVLAALAVRAGAAAVAAGEARFGVGAGAVHVVHALVTWSELR